MERTTLTLEDDVAAKLRERMRAKGTSFKDTVNEVLRLGLLSEDKKPREPFIVKARDLGLKPGYSYDNIEELLDQIDGPDRKW